MTISEIVIVVGCALLGYWVVNSLIGSKTDSTRTGAEAWNYLKDDIRTQFPNGCTIVVAACNSAVSGNGQLSVAQSFQQAAAKDGYKADVAGADSFGWFNGNGGVTSAQYADPTVTYANVTRQTPEIKGAGSTWTLFKSDGTVKSNYDPGIGPVRTQLRNFINDIWAPGGIAGSNFGDYTFGQGAIK